MMAQLIRFLIVGGLATVVNYIIFFILYKQFNIYYNLASAIGFLSGLLVGYPLNKKWTYQADSSDKSQILRYGGVYACSLIISIGCLEFFVQVAGVSPVYANVGAIVVTTCCNFIGTKYFVFNNKSSA
ncbi:MAG: GtrA family protein [Alphaproteobacteria bacterium]|nr:GtrA family protein [Alphaproteobacteria bacterium]